MKKKTGFRKEMEYGLVEDGDSFQKGDEIYNEMNREWQPVPDQWFGMKVIRDESTTFGRFKMLVRRKLP